MSKTRTVATIGGTITFVPTVGSFVKPDEWGLGGNLLKSDWAKAEYYLESGKYTDVKYAVLIDVTGRDRQLRNGNEWWIRVKITFLHEDEPDTTSGGWMLVRNENIVEKFV